MAKKSNPDKGKPVKSYFERLEEWQVDIAKELHSLVLDTVPDVIHGIKWAQPVYEYKGPMIFMKAAKKHVTFGFWRGTDLEVPEGLKLEGTGERMRHIKLTDRDGIKRDLIRDLIKQAMELNEELGDPTKKK